MKKESKLTKARATLVLEQPFFGSLLLRLLPVEARWLDTIGVDGVHLYYNPDYVESLDMPRLKGVLAHEVMHCALGHPWRRRERDPDQWNNACDFAINEQILNAGLMLPEGALIDQSFNDLSAEQIYSRIGQQQQPPQENGSEGQDQGQGQDKSQDQGYSSGDQKDDDNGSGDADKGDAGTDGDSTGDDQGTQSTPDGRPVGSDPTGCGVVIDAPAPEGKSKPELSDIAQLEQEWKVATAQAAQSAQAAGSLPGGVERLVTEELQPQADWAALLRQFMDQFARDDYSWSRPNRRFIGSGVYLPSVHSERVPPIVVAVDTSGSINDELLAKFQGELNSILGDVRPEAVNIVYCDTKITAVQEFTPEDFPIELEAKGGGGTYFQPVFDWVEQEDLEPACLIYLTDMWNGDSIEEPPYPVLWADYGSGTQTQDFGEIINIE